MQLILRFCGLICLVVGLYGSTVLINGYRFGPSDFVQDYAAGHALRHGHTIYGDAIAAYTKDLLGFSGHYNFHPPTNAVLFAPLTFLQYDSAFITWGGLSLILNIWILLASYARFRPELPLIFILGFGFLWFPFLHGIELGQSSILIAASIIAGWFHLQDGKNFRGGALLGFAATIKLFPLFLGLYLLLTKNFRALGGMLGTFLPITLISVTVVGIPDSITYLRSVIPQDIVDWSGSPLNAALSGLLLPVLTHNDFVAPAIELQFYAGVYVVKAISLALTAFTIVRAWDLIKYGETERAFGLLIVSMLLVSPLSWVHIFTLLIPVLMLLWRRAETSPQRYAVLFAVALLAIPNQLVASRIIALWRPGLVPPGVYLVTACSTYGLILMWYILSRRQSETPVVIPVTPRHNTAVL
ncbi:MAG: hypothetical protein RL417_1288 [Pseudomonadota bacterium]|jgi:hypothetical protein